MSREEFTVETYPDRESWLRSRECGIGASEAAAVVGLSTYQSAYGLWIDKTEPFRMEELDELAEWGLILEPVICQEFARRSNVRTHLCQPFSFYRSRERRHVTASVDAIAEGYPPIPVQLKTAHFQAGKVWQKEVPLAYLCQLQTEMYVTGAAYGYIAVLIDGYQFRWHKVPRHQAFIDRLLKRIDHFWNEHVVKRVPPPTDYHEATTKALLRKYPTSTGTVVELPDELEPLYDEMKQLTAAESAASRRKEEIKNHVRERMGNARYGYLPNGKGFQWSGENGTRRFTLTERCPEPASS